jgi:hypothetical protein
MDTSNPFKIEKLPIDIKRGSNLAIPITYTKNGIPVDLTGYAAILTVRQKYGATGSPDIVLSTANGLISISPTAGLIILDFAPGTTLSLDEGYEGEWDLFLLPYGGYAFCIVQGTFKVIDSATRII